MRPSKLAFIVVLLLMIFETVRLWFLSPPTMAAHFNVIGQPDRFVSKADFFSFEIQTVFVVIGLAIITPMLLVIIPMQFINIPNREYWLSSARRPVVLHRLGTFLDVLFITILVVVQAAFELAVYANLHSPILFSSQYMMLCIAGFVLFSLFLLFWLITSFRIPST